MNVLLTSQRWWKMLSSKPDLRRKCISSCKIYNHCCRYIWVVWHAIAIFTLIKSFGSCITGEGRETWSSSVAAPGGVRRVAQGGMQGRGARPLQPEVKDQPKPRSCIAGSSYLLLFLWFASVAVKWGPQGPGVAPGALETCLVWVQGVLSPFTLWLFAWHASCWWTRGHFVSCFHPPAHPEAFLFLPPCMAMGFF